MQLFLLLKRQDWVLNGMVILLGIASITTLASAAPDLVGRQVIWFIAALFFIVAVSLIDVRPLINYRWIILGVYCISLLLLAVTLILAPPVRGVRGWLSLGEFRFQTSELAKIVFLIVLAYFFAHRHTHIAHISSIVASFLYTVLPASIVLLEPDWGSASIFFAVWIGFLFLSGLRMRHLLIGLGVLLCIGFLSWQFFLAGYQKERIVGFFRPEYDPLGVNYNVIQAKIAIGSAGWWGKGFQQGTQVRLGFLPEAENDFAFAAFVEEWGIMGGMVLIGAFVTLLIRLLKIGWTARDNFGSFICLGATLMLLIEFFLNVGSNIGLVPVVGITFPFFSYGGSSIISKALIVGIVQSVRTHTSFS